MQRYAHTQATTPTLSVCANSTAEVSIHTVHTRIKVAWRRLKDTSKMREWWRDWASLSHQCVATSSGMVLSAVVSEYQLPEDVWRTQQLRSEGHFYHPRHADCISVSNLECSVKHKLPCMFLMCSGNDGILKIWTIKTGDCAVTLDHHTDRVSDWTKL